MCSVQMQLFLSIFSVWLNGYGEPTVYLFEVLRHFLKSFALFFCGVLVSITLLVNVFFLMCSVENFARALRIDYKLKNTYHAV